MRKTICILISGRISSGKSTLAGLMSSKLVEMGHVSSVFSFALPLKQIASRLFGWDGIKDKKGRKFLQNLGNTVRGYDENFWVNALFDWGIEQSKFFPFDFILIDDWRYPNEANVVTNKAGYSVIKVRVSRNSEELDDDVSENSLPEINDNYYDFTVYNSGPMDSLVELSSTLVTKILADVSQ